MSSLLDCGTRPIQPDLTPTPPGCTQPFHSAVEDGAVVCDEAYDILLVRQTEEFNTFTRQFHHRDITPPPTPTADELRHQMPNRDRKAKADLAILQHQSPQIGFNRLWIRVFCLKCAAFPFTSLYTTTQTTDATSVWITPSLFWPCIQPRTLSFNTPISTLTTLDSSFHRICTRIEGF
jgi:hypothetical protein